VNKVINYNPEEMMGVLIDVFGKHFFPVRDFFLVAIRVVLMLVYLRKEVNIEV